MKFQLPEAEATAKTGVDWNTRPDSQKLKIIFDMQKSIQEVADLVTANTIFTTKEVLTSDEAARYLGVSKSYLYKLTMGRKIPHFKPSGKLCYFNRVELENWLQTNRVATTQELERHAQNFDAHNRKGGKR